MTAVRRGTYRAVLDRWRPCAGGHDCHLAGVYLPDRPHWHHRLSGAVLLMTPRERRRLAAFLALARP